MHIRNQTVKGLTVAYHTTHGIHWDTDNADVSASGVVAFRNLLMGAFVDADEGAVLISNSEICGAQLSTSSNIGVSVKDSTYLTLSGNTLTNSGGQIVIAGPEGGEPVTNWQTGETTQMYTEHLTLTNNVIEGGSGGALMTATFPVPIGRISLPR
jgi:hypothetical protein